MEFKAGDIVEIKTKDDVFQGRVIPRPELLDSSKVILKLSTGYNIGIDKKKIEFSKIIEKFNDNKKEEKSKLKKDSNLPTISILSCGGTISSKIDYRTGGVYADYTADDFVKMEPDLSNLANLKAKKVMSVMSEDMSYNEWKLMSEVIFEELKTSDAVIVTQGTDTLHYSTAVMSFFLKDINKPVIFTAAQRSIDRGSSDAFMNLLCAVKTAVKFNGAGVFLVMHGSSSDDYCFIHKGTKVRKMHSLRRDAFRSINEIPLAKVYPDKDELEYLNDNYTKQKLDSEVKKSDAKLVNKFEEKVAFIYVYPGMDPEVVDFYLDKGYKGIVLVATALGHVPMFAKKNLKKQLERAKKEKVPIVVATQCLYGRVDPLVYTPLRKLSMEYDVIFAEDMLPEVAYVKLGWVLPQAKNNLEVKDMMTTNYRGEINYTRDPRAFLN
jgi:glutamyl-tRNA(Gln) amidotransferase subunit D